VLLASVLLAACEQVMIVGPVGGASVSVTVLRTGAPVVDVTSDDVDAAGNRWADFDTYNDFTKLAVTGIVILNALPVQEDTWYLLTASGGFDYAQSPEEAPSQVFGTFHALMTGRQLAAGGFVVGPLSEAAYQWVAPYLDQLDDDQLQAALDEYSASVVNNIRDVDLGRLDYDDLLTFNTLYNPPSDFTGDAGALGAMRQALAQGSTPEAKLAIAVDMAGVGAPGAAVEAVYSSEVSSIVQVRCSACHRNGGLAGATDHLLLPDPANVAQNVAMYRSLVAKLGVQGILNKGSGAVAHGGGSPLQVGSADYQALQSFLELL
jgi:hypothetical protein